MKKTSATSQVARKCGCVSIAVEIFAGLVEKDPNIMKTQSCGVQRSARCSGCFDEFPWSVTEAQATNLFPLVCGDIYCRSCLAKEARAVLSTRLAPLRCCEKVVPHDFIREVLEYAEDVYYSFLLTASRDGNGETKAFVIEKKHAKSYVAPLVPSNTGAQIVMNELEMKRPIDFLQDSDANARATIPALSPRQVNSTPCVSPARSPVQQSLPRYFTRSSKAHFASGEDSEPTGTNASAIHQTAKRSHVLIKPALSTCNKCGFRMQHSLFKADCGHDICLRCVDSEVRGYQDAIFNGNTAPVDCCGSLLPLHLVQRVISGPELTEYAKRVYTKAATGDIKSKTRGTKCKAEPVKKSTKSARHTPGSKGKAPAKKAKTAVNQNQDNERICISCYSQVTALNKWKVVPCGHGYCVSCLKTMAKTSMTNRAQVPIRCCSKEFPVEYVKNALTKAQFEQYERFVSERNPETSTLQSDLDYKAVVRKTKGKQCPICGIGVVKIAGCNTIRCPLGHYFCWVCVKTECTCGRIYKYN